MLANPSRVDPVHRLQCLDEAARIRRLALELADREARDRLLNKAEDHERDAWGDREV